MDREAFDQAGSRLSDVRDWWERNFGPDYLFTLAANVDLGTALTGQGAYAEAESILISSHERLRAARGSEDDYTQRAVERLVALYEAWGRPETANRYRLLVR